MNNINKTKINFQKSIDIKTLCICLFFSVIIFALNIASGFSTNFFGYISLGDICFLLFCIYFKKYYLLIAMAIIPFALSDLVLGDYYYIFNYNFNKIILCIDYICFF